MFLFKKSKFFFLVRLMIILFNFDYLLIPALQVEAFNGVIWRKETGNFVQILSIKSFAKINEQRFLISRELESHNFNGNKLKFTSFQIKNLIEFISNNTMVSGVHGDMWNLLSSMYNFTLNCIKLSNAEYGTQSEDGSWDGMLGYIYRNETDIIPRTVVSKTRLSALQHTIALWRTPYRFYMKNQLRYQNTWMAKLFHRNLWFSVVGLFVVLSITSCAIHLMKYKDKKTRDSIPKLGDHFFYFFSIFCLQGWTPPQLEKRSKILMLSTRLFSWLLFIAFSSKLIAHITQRSIYSPFHNVESFYEDTDYEMVVKRNSFAYSIFKAAPRPIYRLIRESGRISESDNEDAYDKTCTGRYVYLEVEDVAEAENSQTCELSDVGGTWFTAMIASAVSREFQYKRTMDLGLLKLHEMGITNRLKLKWLTKLKKQTISNESVPIRLEHVSLILAMLCSVIILSLVILFVEILLTHLKHHRQQRRRKY